MQTRLVSYTIFGARGNVLPDCLQSTVTMPLGELPTGAVHYPLTGVAADKLKSESEVAFEYWNGTAWSEPPNARFFPMGGDLDHLEEVPTRSYKLLGFGWLLRQAKVWEAGTLPIDADGKVQFLSATPGNIMNTLITKAKARGWGAGVAVDFTATTDSSGAAWPKVITMAFDLEISLEAILNNLYQQGLVDYRWEGRTLRMFKPDSTMARERTAKLPLADGVTAAPESWTDEDRLTHTLVIGEKGATWVFGNGATGGFGRLEKVTTQSGVSDPATAQLLSERDLTAGLDTRVSYTREFDLTVTADIEPFTYYLPGDWVQAQRDGAFERLRVMSLSITTKPDAVTGHAVLGDRIDDILAKLAKRTSGITGGATAGGTGGRPAPEGPDYRTPAAPAALVVGSAPYINENGFPRGRIQADWTHSGEATNGTVQAPDRYQLQRRINTAGTKYQTVAEVESATATVIDVPIFKADGVTPEQYAHRVRAVSQEGKVSAWSSTVVTSMETDTTPPAAPYFVQANVTAWLMTVKIMWNGMLSTTGSNQVTPPLDFHHVDVFMDTQASMATKTKVGELYGATDFAMVPAAVSGQILYFHLVAYDRSGNPSTPSANKQITPMANVDLSKITDKLDAATITLTNVGSSAISNLAITNGKLAANAVDNAKLATAVQSAIAEGQTALGNQVAINSSISTLQSSVNGKNSITNSTSAPSDTANPGLVGGDRWQKWTTLSAGGKITNTYRWSSSTSTWAEEALAASYLPLIDIGQGTFGSLDGGRLVANSVRANNLLVTDMANPGPSLAESTWSSTNGAEDWYLAGGMEVVDSGTDTSGKRFNSPSGNTASAYAYGPWKSVKPGESMYVSARAYRAAGALAALYVRYYWYDANKVALTPSNTSSSGNTAGTGAFLSLTATVPAGAAYARVGFAIGPTSNGPGSVGLYDYVAFRQSSTVSIADGAIIGDKVGVNAVTAKHIVIGDFANLAIGSDFEDAAAVPWALHADHTISTAQKKFGTSSLRLPAGAAGARSSMFTNDLRVKAGEQWIFKMWVYIDATFNGGANSKLRIGNLATGSIVGLLDFQAVARSTWVPMETVVTVATGVTALKVELISDNTVGTAYVDDIQIRRMSEASLIQNLGVEKLTATSAAMGQAVIDKLWTDVVNSRKINTNMLVVGRGDNMIPWALKDDVPSIFPHSSQGTGTALTVETDATHSGTASLAGRSTVVTSGTYVAFMKLNSGYTANNGQANHWNATPGEKMMIEAWVRGGGTYVGAQPNIRFQIAYAKPDGSWHSTTYSNPVRQDYTWKKLSHEFTVPSGTVGSMYIYMQQDEPGMVRVDDPFMKPQLQPSLIATGAVLATHLTVTEEMWANIIRFKKLEGGEIDATALTSDTAWIGTLRGGILINDAVTTGMLKADAITAKHTITGAVIQTSASSNTGIKITGTSFSAYASGGTGVKTFEIINATGAVSGTGTWKTGTGGNYATLVGDANGGFLRFFTGSGSGRGSLWARNPGDGSEQRMSMAFGDVDEPSGMLPVVVVTPTRAYMNYGSRTIQCWNNNGVEELLIDATNASVVLRGNLDMRDGRATYRYGSAMTLGYVGQRPESGASPDFEIRAETGGVRITGALTNFQTYNLTTTGTANVNVDASGNFKRSTSASRYKLDQRPMPVRASALDVKVKDWIDIGEKARLAELSALPEDEITEDMRAEWKAINRRRIPGLIAEDLVAAGQDQFVIFGPDGQTEGVMYERFAFMQIAALHEKLNKAIDRIKLLETAAA